MTCHVDVADPIYGDALGRIAFDPDGLGTLRSRREDEGARVKRLELWDGQMLAFPNGHVAEVMDIGAAEDFPVPLSEPSAQFVLIGKDAVFREPAELHVPVQDHDFIATLGHDVGYGHAGRTRPHHHHQMLLAHFITIVPVTKCFIPLHPPTKQSLLDPKA